MGDCHLPLTYTNGPKCEEKFCKYSYATWCPTCEKNSPRQRSKSETNEPCRRKCREMKAPCSRKYTRSQEYENMDLEYEAKDCWSYEPNAYRVRSNLVELPTSYITNNFQTSKLTADADRNVKSHVECGVKMKQEELLEVLHKFDPVKQAKKGPPIFKGNCDNHLCNDLRNPKHQSVVVERDRDFDTCTYFDKIMDPTNFHVRYEKEIEAMREKLASWKKANGQKVEGVAEPIGIGEVEAKRFANVTKFHDRYAREVEACRHPVAARKPEAFFVSNRTLDYRPEIRNFEFPKPEVLKIEILKPEISNPAILKLERSKPKTPEFDRSKTELSRPEAPKSAGKKVSLKTRSKVNAAKLKKVKVNNKPPSNFTEISDYSGSDESDNEVLNGDEESESVSESTPSWSESETTIPQPGGGDSLGWPIRPSLFPNIPPYIRFTPHDVEIPTKVPAGRRLFKWKLSNITPIVVRKTLTNSGFAMVRKSNQWLGTWGKHMKSPMFKTLKDNQKLNHFPGTFQLGRKDRLWRNFQKLINRHGYKEFGFIPQTFVLPQELKLLKQNWEYKNGSGGETWIIKPPASARGVGIKVINKWSQLPKKMSLVVQKYITNPYLINGSKFDLRLYVLVTSFNPLRIYLYPDGLARFASAKYSDDAKDLKDRYMHLTNYSINKLSSQYTANEDANACQGHKWTLTKLLEYMETQGVDTKALWKNLQQLVIKTIITGEAPISQLCDEHMSNRYNCYELFGVDVLLDERLKPWLLEVNISPSLHSASPLDAHVKGPLVHMLFDLAQFHFPPRLAQTVRQSPQCFEPKLYTSALTKKERDKHNLFVQYEKRCDYLDDILTELTGDDVRKLTQAEDEFTVKGRFERIFPTSQTHRYLGFMEPRYYNRLFDAWETRFEKNRQAGIGVLKALCAEKVHLKVAPQSTLNKARNFVLATLQSVCSQCRKFAEYDPCGFESSAFEGRPGPPPSGNSPRGVARRQP